jgi:hypothetical protein
MTLRIPNVGEGNMLEMIVNKTAPENLILKLFTSNTTPADTDTASTYTEASFTGYTAKTLAGSSWTVTPGSPSEAAYAQQTFTSTAGSQSASVYGYYVIQTTSTELMWSERFTDGPYVIVNNGDEIRITPKLTLQDTLD